MDKDSEHLRLLSIFHYVNAGLIGFYSLFGLIYVVIGIVCVVMMPFVAAEIIGEADRQRAAAAQEMAADIGQPTVDETTSAEKDSTHPTNQSQEYFPAPQAPSAFFAIFGLMFVFVGGLFTTIGCGFAVANLIAARCLTAKTHRTYCLVIAAINCINIPIGTILGGCSLAVLLRPSVVELFEKRAVDNVGHTRLE